jgi:hypothetical protein
MVEQANLEVLQSGNHNRKRKSTISDCIEISTSFHRTQMKIILIQFTCQVTNYE